MGLDIKDLQRDLSDYEEILHYLDDYTTMGIIGKHSAVSHKLIVLLDNLKQLTRKQVCDEIREELDDVIEIMGYYHDDENDTETSLIKMTDIEHTLDQIEKGE